MKKVGYIILTLILLVPFGAKALEIDLNSKNAIVYNLDEEKILYEKNADSQTSIASLTKIMTTILSIENIKDLDESVTITSSMLSGIPYDASTAGLNVGDKLTYKDLLYSSMLPSGADATQALAVSLTGSVSNFVEKMNEKAAELNLTNTHFANTTGLDEQGHYSTAKDVLTLLNYALKNKTFKTIFTTKYYTTTNDLSLKSTLDGYNRTLNYDLSYVLGSKTGFTDEAGYCLTTLSNIDNTNIITVTINAPTTGNSKNLIDLNQIHDSLKDNYSKVNIVNENDTLIKLETKYTKESEIKIKAEKDIQRYVENPFEEEQVKIKYKGEKIISSNTKKGTKLGKLTIYYKDELIEEIPVILDEELHFSVWNYLKENIYYYIGLILIVIITLKVLKKSKKKRIRR